MALVLRRAYVCTGSRGGAVRAINYLFATAYGWFSLLLMAFLAIVAALVEHEALVGVILFPALVIVTLIYLSIKKGGGL
jgi:uncharacterized membrane protein